MARKAVTDSDQRFREFVHMAEPKLSLALAAAYGPQVGHDATAEALGYAWEHWTKVEPMENPCGYLYRVGQSKARRHLRREHREACPPVGALPPSNPDPWIEPALPGALGGLSRRQRTTVVLVHGFGWTQNEVAVLLGVSRTTVERHLQRGLERLRERLKVTAS